MFLRIDGKTAQAANCVTSMIITKVIDYFISINTFEKCVVIKGMLQSPHIKYHMKTIGIDQSLSNSAIFEQKYLQNINKLYQHDGKCYYQQQFKDILEDAMVSIPVVFTDNSPKFTMNPTQVKKPSAR